MSMLSQERAAPKAYVEIVVDGHHWSITACALAFHLNHSKLGILGCITDTDPTEMLFDSVQNVCGAA
jgi:N-acetylglucosamine-6-phosphate deacetylase